MKKNNEIKKEIISAILILALIYLLNVFYIGTNYNIWIVLESGKALILEVIIGFLMCIMLLGIFKKGKRAITILGVMILIIAIINQIKFAFTGEPVLLSDALYLQNTGELMQIVEGELWSTIKLFIVPIIIEIILFAIFIAIGRYSYNKIEINSIKARLALIIIPLLVFAILILPIGPINKFMLNFVFDFNNRKDYAGITSISQYYLNYGIIGGMYGQLLENRIQEPEGYDEENVNKELSKVEENQE